MSVVAPSGVLAACAPDADEVRLSGWDPPEIVDPLIASFLETDPGVVVDYRHHDPATYVQEIGEELASGDGPDVLYVPENALAAWAETGYLRSLDGMPDIDELYEALYPGVAASMTYRGGRFGMPYDTDVVALVYNAKLLDQAGFTAPPTTLDALFRQAELLKERGIAKYPIGLPVRPDVWWPWWWALVFASGGQLFDDHLNPIMASSEPVARTLLEWLQGAARRGLLDPQAGKVDARRLDREFMAGQYAYVLTTRQSIRLYNDPDGSEIAGAATLAAVPGLESTSSGTVSSTQLFGLSGRSKRPDDAYRLLSWLGGLDARGDPQGARFWFENHGRGFAYPSLARDPDIKARIAAFADPSTYAELSQVARPRRAVAAPWYAEFEAESQRAIADVLAGTASPAAAVRRMARAATAPEPATPRAPTRPPEAN